MDYRWSVGNRTGKRAGEHSPQGRLIEANEIADLMVYLSTDSSRGLAMENRYRFGRCTLVEPLGGFHD